MRAINVNSYVFTIFCTSISADFLHKPGKRMYSKPHITLFRCYPFTLHITLEYTALNLSCCLHEEVGFNYTRFYMHTLYTRRKITNDKINSPGISTRARLGSEMGRNHDLATTLYMIHHLFFQLIHLFFQFIHNCT